MMGAGHRYNFWHEHLRFVVREALALADAHHTNVEIVKLVTLLHDVAWMTRMGSRAEHHVNGAMLAETMREKYHYPKEKSDQVMRCVYNPQQQKSNGT